MVGTTVVEVDEAVSVFVVVVVTVDVIVSVSTANTVDVVEKVSVTVLSVIVWVLVAKPVIVYHRPT